MKVGELKKQLQTVDDKIDILIAENILENIYTINEAITVMKSDEYGTSNTEQSYFIIKIAPLQQT